MSGRELKTLAAKRDMKSAVANMGPGHKYKKGQVWSFWIEDDPRADDGISIISRFRCVQGGDDDSLWERMK